MATYFEELFDPLVELFKQHLIEDSNKRILFSGKFGMGKTAFLDSFFKHDHQKKIFGEEVYEVYWLSPVNYSVAANHDIVDYIKYDIVLEFLRKGYTFQEEDYSYLKTLPPFLRKNLLDILKVLVTVVPKVGKEIVEMHDKLMGLWDRFDEFHKKANESDGDKLTEFLGTMESKKGSPYVADLVTKIIQNVITKEGKNSILIIDDLDRLDPEHIFRLLNIFSAHFHEKDALEVENKFGFDKIIMVCDYNNIKQVFHHRYGEKTDFAGYIDKFFSTDVFYFDNRAAIATVIEKIFNTFVYVHSYPQSADGYLLGDNFVVNIVTVFVEYRLISLRNLMKQQGRSISLFQKKVKFGKERRSIEAIQLRIVMQIAFLADLFGDDGMLDRSIEAGLNSRITFDEIEQAIGLLIMLVTYRQEQYLATNKRSPFNIKWGTHQFVLRYNMEGRTIESAQIYTEPGQPEHSVDDPVVFWTLLKEAVALLREIQFLR